MRSRWILTAVSTALFCVQLDYFAMNLALPRTAADLGSTTTDLQWVVSVYMLTVGAFMVPAGRIGDIFGRRRALLGGIALFGIASVGCALAPTAVAVIGFRALQGTGCTAAAVSLAGLAVSQRWVPYLAALTVCGFTMGLVYAFTTVATQTVVAPERAGEAAGVTLTALVTIVGIGVAVSGTVLEVLQHQHFTTAAGIERIPLVIAALLLPAGLAVLWKARDRVANFTGKY
ncbi:hypothetical protein TL10_01045 [Mycolicibacterium llatzerense]|uniref:Major facilitator superfamily (MFS) profile domain-containing protein n=1 Tax=Mycolicibacterium llatzerense TaxID=280871 RepID=A0A0D1LRW8_9MYCO|nr:hypothetical protein TL10_01045 [Mycolicibacterium llatzerense]